MRCMSNPSLLSQLRRGVLPYCLLALLRDEERYGFDLASGLGGQDGMAISQGTIYPLLTRLAKDGLVTTAWRESAAGPPRKYYALSAQGIAALTAFAEQWAHFRDDVDALMEKGQS